MPRRSCQSRVVTLFAAFQRSQGGPARTPTTACHSEPRPTAKNLMIVRSRTTSARPLARARDDPEKALFLIKDFHRVPGIVGRLLLVLQRAFEVHLGQMVFRIKLEIAGK